MTNPVAEEIFEYARQVQEDCDGKEDACSLYCWSFGDYHVGVIHAPMAEKRFEVNVLHTSVGLNIVENSNDAEEAARKAYWSLVERIQAIVN